MSKRPGDDQAPNQPLPAKPAKPKSGPSFPTTKADRAARMRADKMVIKRMRKR